MREYNELAAARVVVTKRTNFRFIAAAMMTVFFCVTAFGQSSTYSDVWGDTEYVYGCGVTEMYGFGNYVRVSTRITNPNGGYNEYDTGEQSNYAEADVTLPRELVGDYSVQSDHWLWCETAYELEYAGSTLTSLFFGRWSEKWYTTTDATVFPNGGTCVYRSDCLGGGYPPCDPDSEITNFCERKYIKEVIPLDGIYEECNYSGRHREFWDTKFGTCGKKPY